MTTLAVEKKQADVRRHIESTYQLSSLVLQFASLNSEAFQRLAQRCDLRLEMDLASSISRSESSFMVGGEAKGICDWSLRHYAAL